MPSTLAVLPCCRAVAICLPLALVACGASPPPPAAASSPAAAVVVADGWRADLAHDSDEGVWYAKVDKVVAAHGANEVVVTDDAGRLTVLTVYSGQWTAHSAVGDGQWLAPTRAADVDPRVPGAELYAAGKGGSLFRVTLRPQPFGKFTVEAREVAHAPGEEFHAVVAGDFAPGGQAELLLFGITGAVYAALADGESAFALRRVASVNGRVRDVAIASAAAGEPPVLYGASRSGELLALRHAPDGLAVEVALREDCGLGRVALAPGRGDVVYATRDDGVLLRCERAADGSWRRAAIFAGEQGLRGVAAGRFFADGREAVAVYGYDRTVHLVSRPPGGAFAAEALLRAPQKGHWLAVGELDGRNGTDELVATGFDGEVFVLARAAGYGLPGAALPPR